MTTAPDPSVIRGTRPVQRGRGDELAITVLGGPTALLELGGLRFLTDPTFDPPGSYPIGGRTLVKTAPSAWTSHQVGSVDAVLLSHDQHPDNLDRGGREFLRHVPLVLTTAAAAKRLEQDLDGRAAAVSVWATVEFTRPHGRPLQVTAVPARHGPQGCEGVTGPVTGFVLSGEDLPTVYVSGDNASVGLVRSIAERFGPIHVAVLFAGAARTALLEGAALTLTSDQAVEAARILGAHIVPVHVEGWAHFTQGLSTLTEAFARAGICDQLVIAPMGTTIHF